MTITEAESGLSSADYAVISDQTGSLSAEVLLQRYGPIWADHPNDTDNGRGGENFDAIVVGHYLLRAYGCTVSEVSVDYMPSEVSVVDDASWNVVDATAIGDIDATIPISLVSGTSPLARLFYVDAAGVLKYSENTDITANAFGAPVTVCSPSDDVEDIAATYTTRVHYTTKTSQNNRRLHYAQFNGSWSAVSSDVYWPFPIYGFDAVALDADTDLIILATELPPLLGSRVVGAEIQKEVNRVQGLVLFKVKNGRWSDWQLWDTIDRVPEDYPKSRDDVRLSFHNDLLFATYDRSGGDGEYEYTYPGVSRSGDGENWEYPEFIPDADAPYVILPRDDYLYAVGISGTLRSPRCRWAGQTPVEFDVTDYVLGTDSWAADIRQSSAEMANPPTSVTDIFEGILEGELPLDDARLQLRYSLGYWIDGDARHIQVSLEDVVERGEQRGIPKLNLTLSSEDYLGRMNRVYSDFAAEWPSMQCGKDPFEDVTDTGYGGLRHMAPIKPSFKADGGILQLISNNKEGIAISTFVSDALCGSVQTSIDLINDDESEYQGLTFRVFDKDNLYYCAYYPDSNVFKLYKRTGIVSGDVDYTDTLLATSDAIASWAGTETDKHWMKVLVRYNQFVLYRSDNGLSWTTVTWSSAEFVELPGHTSHTDIVWSGRFGVIGYGYSDTDVPPTTWPDIPWPPPTVPAHWGVIVLSSTQLARSWDFFSAEDPSWEDIEGDITGTLYNIVRGEANQLYVTSDDGLWYCADATEATPAWTCIKTDAAAATDAGRAGMFASVDVHNHVVKATWHCDTNPGGYFSGTPALLSYIQFTGVRCVGDRMGWCIDARDGVIGCGDGAPAGACIHTIGGGYTSFTTEWGYIACARGGFCIAWNGNMYSAYTPGTVYDTAAPSFGIDVLESTPLYRGADGHLYRALVKIAEVPSIFGAAVIAGHGGYTRGDIDEMLWVCASASSPTVSVLFVWTDDAFTSFHDKTGDYLTAIGPWAGATGSSGAEGNATFVTFSHDVAS